MARAYFDHIYLVLNGLKYVNSLLYKISIKTTKCLVIFQLINIIVTEQRIYALLKDSDLKDKGVLFYRLMQQNYFKKHGIQRNTVNVDGVELIYVSFFSQ